jgi:hypothetical protein
MLKMPSYYLKNPDELKKRAKYQLAEYYRLSGEAEARIPELVSRMDSLSISYSPKNTRIG